MNKKILSFQILGVAMIALLLGIGSQAHALTQSPNIVSIGTQANALAGGYQETLIKSTPFSIFGIALSNEFTSTPRITILCQSQINDGGGDSVTFYDLQLNAYVPVIQSEFFRYCDKKLYVGVQAAGTGFSGIYLNTTGITGNYATSSKTFISTQYASTTQSVKINSPMQEMIYSIALWGAVFFFVVWFIRKFI